MSQAEKLGRVVVVGAGFAGLLTAYALAEHADRVTIVDRDRAPDEPRPRAGVPQGRHPHVLLAAGQQTLESMLPGVLDELTALGAPLLGLPRDLLQISLGRWVRRWHECTPFLTGTRPLLEHVVRRRVLAHPRIAVVDGTEVVGLSGDSARVDGVVVRERRAGTVLEALAVLAADLVVDASGQSSRAPQWLTELGATPPAEERIDTGLAYATRVYHATPDHETHDYKGIYLVPHPLLPRGGVVMPTEEPGRYLVMLSGLTGEQPPTDPAGFEAFAGTLEHRIVSDWMAAAEADGPAVGYRNTANVRRRYDLLDGPDGLLVVGDAACVFNPIYGQGISVAALEAAAVRDAVKNGRRTTRQLQQNVMAAAEQAWAISAGADKTMPGATGDGLRSGLADRLAGWYLGRVQAHSATNQTVGSAFSGVIHLTSPPTALFAWPVVRIALFRRPQPGAAEPPLFAERPEG